MRSKFFNFEVVDLPQTIRAALNMVPKQLLLSLCSSTFSRLSSSRRQQQLLGGSIKAYTRRRGFQSHKTTCLPFPCPSHSNIAFEFARWIFPTLSVDLFPEERLNGLLGGKLSLGKLRTGARYCIGVVVETSIGGANQADTAGNKTCAGGGTERSLSDWRTLLQGHGRCI